MYPNGIGREKIQTKMSKKKKDDDLDNNTFAAVNIDKSLNDSE